MTRLLVIALLATACTANARQVAERQVPPRSPSYDYPADGPHGTTLASDGSSLGADDQSLSDKLDTGVQVGTRGAQPGVQTPEYGASGPDYGLVLRPEEAREREQERRLNPQGEQPDEREQPEEPQDAEQ